MEETDQQMRSGGVGVNSSVALTAIYDEHYWPLYRYIYRQVSDVEVSRDLVAEVFRRLLQAFQDVRGPESDVRAWLYRVAHNVVVDHYRWREHRQHLSLDDQTLAADDNPVIEVERQLDAERVLRAIRHLTPDQQQVITLKFLGELSNAEVAEVIDKPIGAVKALQHRALAALRRYMTPAKEMT